MTRALVNGRPGGQISVLDRGLQFGDGLFETLAVMHGRPCLWDRHLQRLNSGCAQLGIPAPDTTLIEKEARVLLQGMDRAILKILVTRGPAERGYTPPQLPAPTRILYAFSWRGPAAHSGKAVVRICSQRLGLNPYLAGVKHLNRLEQVLGRAEWSDNVLECIMLDVDGFVIEGTSSNIFLLKRGGLYTPRLDRCGVAGVVRGLVFDVAARMGTPVHQVQLSLADVLEAEALFLTSSLLGVCAISRLQNMEWIAKKYQHPVMAEVAKRAFSANA